ncbi:MATE family efflux transporter [Tropicimonas sp. IMCC34011]|uniref:MATE family efflux transporter n=1 Tax=Tropicimonas sp. IMCC34011 TaxID=2248759 RepID=UPI000E228656|nr:MATE family efflux transporter [Tropicimonas sp. IMCC34011]
MTDRLSIAGHARALLSLGLPLVGANLGMFVIGMTDTAMLGRYSVEALAAGVLGQSFFILFFLFGAGFAQAVLPMVAAQPETDEGRLQVRRVMRMGLWLSVIFSLILLPLFWFSGSLLLALGQEPRIAALTADYLRIVGPGLVPALAVMVLKSYLSALERTQISLWVTVGAVVVNIAVNWVLIFGNLGAPELGVQGAALASVSVHLVSLLGLALYAQHVFPVQALFARLWVSDGAVFWQVFRLGWPIGLTQLAEVGLFSATAVMIGWLGAVPLAAHGIALQIATATFVVHLGLSSAATIRAGRAFGLGDMRHLRRGAFAALGLSGLMVLLTVAVFLLAPEPLMVPFLDPEDPQRPRIVALGTSLIAVAALFQMADAAQVMALGFLRGMQDTRVPMIYATIAYWLVGLPASYILGFPLGLGAPGVWGGLVIGLAVAATLLMLRFWRAGRVPAPQPG